MLLSWYAIILTVGTYIMLRWCGGIPLLAGTINAPQHNKTKRKTSCLVCLLWAANHNKCLAAAPLWSFDESVWIVVMFSILGFFFWSLRSFGPSHRASHKPSRGQLQRVRETPEKVRYLAAPLVNSMSDWGFFLFFYSSNYYFSTEYR